MVSSVDRSATRRVRLCWPTRPQSVYLVHDDPDGLFGRAIGGRRRRGPRTAGRGLRVARVHGARHGGQLLERRHVPRRDRLTRCPQAAPRTAADRLLESPGDRDSRLDESRRSQVLHRVFGYDAFRGEQQRDHRARRRRRRRAGADADRRRQVAVLPDPGAGPRRRRRGDLAADRADAGPGRRAARARRAGRVPQLHPGLRRSGARSSRRSWPASSTCSTSRRSGSGSSPRCGCSTGQDRAVRDRRGALRVPVGPRLPARLPDAVDAARALARRAADRADRDRDRGHARGDRDPAEPRATPGTSWPASTGPTSSTGSCRRTSPQRQLLDLLRTEHAGDAGIVYCLSRTSVEKTAEFLTPERASTALPYHAGLDAGTRAAQPGPVPARGRAGRWSRRSRSAWASTSPTCGSSPTSTCRSRSRATTRRPAAPGGTGCRRPPGWRTGCRTSSSSAR